MCGKGALYYSVLLLWCVAAIAHARSAVDTESDWHIQLIGEPLSAHALAKDVLVCSTKGTVGRVRGSDELIWRQALDVAEETVLCAFSDSFVASVTLDSSLQQHHVTMYDARRGRILWDQWLPSTKVAAASFLTGHRTLVLCSTTAECMAVSATTGAAKAVWQSVSAPGQAMEPIAVLPHAADPSTFVVLSHSDSTVWRTQVSIQADVVPSLAVHPASSLPGATGHARATCVSHLDRAMCVYAGRAAVVTAGSGEAVGVELPGAVGAASLAGAAIVPSVPDLVVLGFHTGDVVVLNTAQGTASAVPLPSNDCPVLQVVPSLAGPRSAGSALIVTCSGGANDGVWRLAVNPSASSSWIPVSGTARMLGASQHGGVVGALATASGNSVVAFASQDHTLWLSVKGSAWLPQPNGLASVREVVAVSNVRPQPVYVAVTAASTVVAMDTNDGNVLWSLHVPTLLDSPGASVHVHWMGSLSASAVVEHGFDDSTDDQGTGGALGNRVHIVLTLSTPGSDDLAVWNLCVAGTDGRIVTRQLLGHYPASVSPHVVPVSVSGNADVPMDTIVDGEGSTDGTDTPFAVLVVHASDQAVHVVPPSATKRVRRVAPHLFWWSVQGSAASDAVLGWTLDPHTLAPVPVWQHRLTEQVVDAVGGTTTGQRLQPLASPVFRPVRSRSDGRVLGRHTVDTAAVFTTIPTAGSSADHPGVELWVVHTATGMVLLHHVYPDSVGPTHVLAWHNSILVTHRDVRKHRHSFTSVQLFEPRPDVDTGSGVLPWSPRVFPSAMGARPHVPAFAAQTSLLPLPVSSLAISASRVGVAPVHVLLGTPQGAIVGLDARHVDPLRPHKSKFTASDAALGHVPYRTLLGWEFPDEVTARVAVPRLRIIHSCPGSRESSSHVLGLGLDVWHMEGSPGVVAFDRLGSSFDRITLVLTSTLIVGLALAATHMARRASMQYKWR